MTGAGDAGRAWRDRPPLVRPGSLVWSLRLAGAGHPAPLLLPGGRVPLVPAAQDDASLAVLTV